MKIANLLNIQPGMTALIGGGGKTTLMYKLAQELSQDGTVIVCTSTKILVPDHLPVLTDASEKAITEALKNDRVICVGTRVGGGKLCSPAIGFDILKALADYVIVEADGAHRLPIKAHETYEPVIPEGTDMTVLAVGADAFGQPIGDICHRPELFAQIAGVDIRSTVTPELAARVIESEHLSDSIYINKIEDEKASVYASELAMLINLPVTAGSLIKEEYRCLR